MNCPSFSIRSVALCAAWLLAGAPALAESTYGYNTAGGGTVTATARVNLSVTVPKMILLRVGSATGSGDTAAWTVGASIPGTPTTPSGTGNSLAVNWDGTAPALSPTASPAALNVFAWTNASAGALSCALGAWSATGGPGDADFGVTVTGSLPHPGAHLGACASTAIPSNAVLSGTWQYVLGGTPGAWSAGAYTNVVTYTASGI